MKKLYSQHFFQEVYAPLNEITVEGVICGPYPGNMVGTEQTTILLQAKTATQFGVNIEVSEVLQYIQSLGELRIDDYAYQVYDPRIKGEDSTILRFDNAPHHPGLPNFPHHKHVGTVVTANSSFTLTDLCDMIVDMKDKGLLDEMLRRV